MRKDSLKLQEERIYACEDEEDVEDLWYKIALKAQNYVHKDIKGLLTFVEDLNPNSMKDLNSMAETRAGIDPKTGELIVDIHFDRSFYDLTVLYQVGVVCHEMGHAERIYDLYDQLLAGEITVDDWNKESKSGGHGNEWKKITRNIAIAANIKPEVATLEKIDFTDDTYFQSKLDDLEAGRKFSKAYGSGDIPF